MAENYYLYDKSEVCSLRFVGVASQVYMVIELNRSRLALV